MRIPRFRVCGNRSNSSSRSIVVRSPKKRLAELLGLGGGLMGGGGGREQSDMPSYFVYIESMNSPVHKSNVFQITLFGTGCSFKKIFIEPMLGIIKTV